jgi:release factor glutamine methyltransferase
MPVRTDPDTLVGSRPTVRTALEVGEAALRGAGIDGGRVDAEWLLAEALGVARGRLGLEGHRVLEPPTVVPYVLALRRRMAREPLQHIVGTQPFRHVTLKVTADALVPRPETELLAGWALELLPRAARPLVLDVGTGSGCIACALASERPDVDVVALDVSPGAVALARANAATLGLSARVRVVQSDLFAELGAMSVHLIVSNPPYLPTASIPSLAPEVSRHDPRLALDGGPDGLDVIRRIVDAAPSRLVPGGWLVLETAGDGQVREVVARMSARGFVHVETRPDLAGIVRFVAGGMS